METTVRASESSCSEVLYPQKQVKTQDKSKSDIIFKN